MSRVIWKFPVPIIPGSYPIEMPVRSRVISCAMAQGIPSIWAEVTPEYPKEHVMVHIVWTGAAEVPINARFIGTIVLDDGALVQNVYVDDPLGVRGGY